MDKDRAPAVAVECLAAEGGTSTLIPVLARDQEKEEAEVEAVAKAESECHKCGRCCIVCTDIQLTREEVREGLYPKQRRHSKENDTHGWSKWIMMRHRVYEPELKCEIFACVFWDPLTRECLIYDDRPTVCQMFHCAQKGAPRVHRIWLKIKKKRLEPLCLTA